MGVAETDLGSHKKVRNEIINRQNSDSFLQMPFGKDNDIFRIYYNKLEALSQRARYLGIYGTNDPIDEDGWYAAIDTTDVLLHYFLTKHPKITQPQHPFDQLTDKNFLQPITFSIPNAPAWTSQNGLFTIQSP